MAYIEKPKFIKPENENFHNIRYIWEQSCSYYPLIYCGVYDYKTDLADKDKCKKNEIWIGIKNCSGKKIIRVIKYDFIYTIKLKKDFNLLSLKELYNLKLLPEETQFCDNCKEFSTTIIKYNNKFICPDCIKDVVMNNEFNDVERTGEVIDFL